MSLDRFQPSQAVKRQLLLDVDEEVKKTFSGKKTAQLQENILIGQEIAALTEMPGWTRVERILTKKLMNSIEAGKADVTAEITHILKLVYLPLKLAEKANDMLAKNAEQEAKNERSREERGRERRGSIFSRRKGGNAA